MFARIACPGNEQTRRGQGYFFQGSGLYFLEVRSQKFFENKDGLRSLQSKLYQGLRFILDPDLARGMLFEPLQYFFGINGINGEHEAFVGQSEQDAIVQDKAPVIAEESIVRGPVGHFYNIPGKYPLQESYGVLSIDLDATEETHIEQTCCGAHRVTFINGVGVLLGDLPSLEVRHFRPELKMLLVKYTLFHAALLGGCSEKPLDACTTNS
jgi:hypothetical protein